MPLQRRLPKRGFHNPFRVQMSVVNLSQLEAFAAEAARSARKTWRRMA